MNNAEAKAAAWQWHGQAGGEVLPLLTVNELAGIVNEALERTALSTQPAHHIADAGKMVEPAVPLQPQAEAVGFVSPLILEELKTHGTQAAIYKDKIGDLVPLYAAPSHLAACAGGGVKAPLTVSVCHFGDGDDPFVFQCNGRVTAEALADINKDLQENRDGIFKNGPGTYEFNVTRFKGQYGEFGRCELAPGWEFEQTGFTSLNSSLAAASIGKATAPAGEGV